MSFRIHHTLPLLFFFLLNYGSFVPHVKASDGMFGQQNSGKRVEAYQTVVRRLIGIWDLTEIDGKPATEVFTTEFHINGTYSVTTVPCSKENGTWSATPETINATVTHSPICESNVGKKFSDLFAIYGDILIVYIFDKKNTKHAYKFKKRTIFFET